jgi:hypothetical protein
MDTSETGRDRPRVEVRRHDENAKLRSKALTGAQREGHAEICLEVVLAELAQDDKCWQC